MTKQEKQLLLIDLSARLQYGVKVQVCNVVDYTPTLQGLLGDNIFLQFDYNTKPVKNGDSTYNLIEDNIKPYLRPMTSMTDEEHNLLINLFDTIYNPKAEFYLVADFYNRRMLDYRNLINQGLALEAPEGMYK